MSRLTYKLTDETKEINGVILHRIEAIKDIPYQNVEIGDKGGWLEKERLTDGTPVISDDAWVKGNAMVYGDAMIYDNAMVYDNARIYDNAMVSGDARISDNARIYDNAIVYGDATISGNAMVYGDAMIYDNAIVYGDAEVCGDAIVCGSAELRLPRRYKSGHFIGGFDGKDKVTNITGETGSTWWKNQYVLGDYKITEIEDKQIEQADTIEVVEINGKKYNTQDVEERLAELEEIK